MTTQEEELGWRDKDRPVSVVVTDTHIQVTLADNRIISAPLYLYPVVRDASPAERNHIELSYTGLHWPDLDEDLSVRGFLLGNPSMLQRRK